MMDNFWEEALECARRAKNLRQLLDDGTKIGAADRVYLRKQADALERRAAVLKARAAASSGPQNSLTRKRRLHSRKESQDPA